MEKVSGTERIFVIDTGGYVKVRMIFFLKEIRRQVELAIDEADAIVLW